MPMNIDADYVREMATQLASYEVHGALQRVERNESVYQAQRDALQQLRGLLTDFSGTLGKLNARDSQMVVGSAAFSHEDYATAEVSGEAVEGHYQFFVEQLASAHQIALQFDDNEPLGLSGTLTIGQGDESFDVDLDALDADATAADLVAAINDASVDNSVRAALVRSGGTMTLVLSSQQTGEQGAIMLNTAELTGDLPEVVELAAAQDAIVRLGGETGIELTNHSNQFDDIIEGVALTFERAHSSGEVPLTVDVYRDMDATREQADTFVSAFNALIGGIQDKTDSGGEGAPRAAFAGDASVRALTSQLNRIIRANSDAEGPPQLHDFGITGDRNGRLQIDSSRFEAAVSADPEAFEALFTGSGGLLDSLDARLKTYTNNTNGILKGRIDRMDTALSRVDQQIEDLQRRYDTYYDRYLRQFTNMMQTVQAMQQTQGMF